MSIGEFLNRHLGFLIKKIKSILHYLLREEKITKAIDHNISTHHHLWISNLACLIPRLLDDEIVSLEVLHENILGLTFALTIKILKLYNLPGKCNRCISFLWKIFIYPCIMYVFKLLRTYSTLDLAIKFLISYEKCIFR